MHVHIRDTHTHTEAYNPSISGWGLVWLEGGGGGVDLMEKKRVRKERWRSERLGSYSTGPGFNPPRNEIINK